MPKPVEVISHWHHYVENLETSALDYYTSIEMALIAKRADVQVDRVQWNESGILSAKREYLRVSQGRWVFDISAFPEGRDYYFSWWHGRKQLGMSALVGCLGLLALPILFLLFVATMGLVKGVIVFLIALGILLFMTVQNAEHGDSEVAEALTLLPYAGPVLKKLFKPATYYTEDTRIAFAELVERVVQDVIGGIRTVKKMSPLTPEERKPIVSRVGF